MPSDGIVVFGSVSTGEIKEALEKAFPNKNVSISEEIPSEDTIDKLGGSGIIIADHQSNEAEKNLKTQLDRAKKDHKEAEEAANKALLSIQTFHKQQQALFDEFVLLRQRYDEQKASTVNILWNHCSRYHPDLRQIPNMEDVKTFTENEEQIGEYKVGDLLGEGQFATVKNCYLDGVEKAFALKIINKERITSFTALMRVSNEIDNLKLLNNEYIVNVHKVIHTENMLYIITEKGGRDLFDFFDEHPDGVPEEWAKQIIVAVLKGVMFCHDQGICHRDLKPENILLDFDQSAGRCVDLKLCDFGLSTKFKPKTLLTDFCGSPGFFAPEMILYGSYYGDKADVWSTGCILLELVAGHEKFCDVWMTAYDYEILQDKDKFTEAIHDTLDHLPSELSFSADLNNFILRFLELRTNKRPNVVALCGHQWLSGLVDEELNARAQKQIESRVSNAGIQRSPSQSSLDLNSLMREDEDDHDSRMDRQYVEMIFSNLSERERKHMQDYIIHHASDGPGQHHAQMHLPPIVPATPNIGVAKKILRKGDELANQNFNFEHAGSKNGSLALESPTGASSAPSLALRSPSTTSNSFNRGLSPLPGVSEAQDEDTAGSSAHDKQQLFSPKANQRASIPGPNSGDGGSESTLMSSQSMCVFENKSS